MTTETTIRTSGVSPSHATFTVTTPAGIWSISFDRAGAISVDNAPGGVGKSSAATAGGIAKRLGLRAKAVALFATFDAEQAAKKAAAPAKVAKAPKVNDGFDTLLAKRSGIPNLAGWKKEDGELRFSAWTIRPQDGGFAWVCGGEVHLTAAKKAFRSELDACRSAQAAQFPDWKKGSFESFLAAAA